MRIPQPVTPFRVSPQPVQSLCSGRGDKINVPYIRCLDGRMLEAYELWALVEYVVLKVHPYARVKLLSEFREILFTPTSSMHDDSRFLSWVADP